MSELKFELRMAQAQLHWDPISIYNDSKRCAVMMQVLVGDTNSLHDNWQCPVRLNLQVSRLCRLFAIHAEMSVDTLRT